MRAKSFPIRLHAISIILAAALFLTNAWAATNWNEKVLLNFNGMDGGFYPQAGVVFDAAGNLYGTSSAGGTYGYGTVFELSPGAGGGWTETVLYSFAYGTDGAYPQANVIFDAVGNLYGTTTYGGAYNYGTVFKLSPVAGGGWTETVLYSFTNNGTDGVYPEAGLIFDAAGNLYGTTIAGGPYYCRGGDGYGCGTVFELSPQAGGGWTETVLHSFGNGTDGAFPAWASGLVSDATGNLYGATTYGGSETCPDQAQFNGCGTVFEISPTAGGGWTETVLHNFGNGSPGNGWLPIAGLIFDPTGNLYGTTIEGGANGYYGNLFELSPLPGGGWTETVRYTFSYNDEAPFAPLVFDAAGNLYSTTGGTVIELSPTGSVDWTYTVLYSFCSQNNCTDGSDPLGGLIFDAVGNLYGTTKGGGTYGCTGSDPGCGTVFELTPVNPCASCNRGAFPGATVLPAAKRGVLE